MNSSVGGHPTGKAGNCASYDSSIARRAWRRKRAALKRVPRALCELSSLAFAPASGSLPFKGAPACLEVSLTHSANLTLLPQPRAMLACARQHLSRPHSVIGARRQPRLAAACRPPPRRAAAVVVRADAAPITHFLGSFFCLYTAMTWANLRRARIQVCGVTTRGAPCIPLRATPGGMPEGRRAWGRHACSAPRTPPHPLQAEKIEQLNLEREAARQERLRRLQPAAVRAEPLGAAEAESER